MDAEPERKFKILIADDDADILASLKMALTETGHEITTVSDGLAAIEWAEAQDPDIVILDLMLPKRGGFQILQKLKGNVQAQGKRPLICMITGNEGMRHKEFAERNGVDDFLRKPFAMGRMLEVVNGFFETLRKGIPDAKPRK